MNARFCLLKGQIEVKCSRKTSDLQLDTSMAAVEVVESEQGVSSSVTHVAVDTISGTGFLQYVSSFKISTCRLIMLVSPGRLRNAQTLL